LDLDGLLGTLHGDPFSTKQQLPRTPERLSKSRPVAIHLSFKVGILCQTEAAFKDNMSFIWTVLILIMKHECEGRQIPGQC